MKHRFRRLLDILGKADPAAELDEELEFHFGETIRCLRSEGLSEAEARREAGRRFGDRAYYREEILQIDRDQRSRARRSLWWDQRLQDLRETLRGVARDPIFLGLVAVTLGLGVGTAAAMFGIVDRLLLSTPPGVAQPDEIARLSLERIRQGEYHLGNWISWQDLQDLEGNPAFTAAAGYATARVVYGEGREARAVQATLFSEDYFELLGPRAALGRFPAAEEHPDSGTVAPAVLGWEFWRGSFGGDPQVLGRILTLGEGRYQVVGVAPEGFAGVDLERVDIWLPLRAAAHEVVMGSWRTSRRFYWIKGLVRVAPEVTVAQAISSANSRYRAVNQDDPQVDRAGFVPFPIVAGRGSRAGEAKVSLWLMWVSLAVLAIATANVANLQMVRAVRRRRETAVRLALGIGRSRLLGQMVFEGLVFSSAGLGFGLVLAAVGGGALRRFLLPEVTWPGGLLDGKMVAVAIALGIVAGLLAIAVPGWQATRTDFVEDLKSGSRSGVTRSRLQSGLLVTQATLSVVMLVGAGLFVRSLAAVQRIDLGWNPSTTGMAQFYTLGFDVARDQLDQWYHTAAQRLEGSSQVAGVALSSSIPFWSSWAESLSIPGRDSLPKVADGGPYILAVTPSFFETLDLEIVQGRGFVESDDAGSAPVTVVSNTMARLLWPGENPVGQCLQIGGPQAPCATVVGVAEDSHRQRIFEGPTMQYYIPLPQDPFDMGVAALMFKADGGREVGAAVATVLQSVAPELPPARVRRLQDLVAPQTRDWRLGATMFTVFGGLALAVAAVGLFSLLSYLVGRRLPELGVRAALGASRLRLIWLVMTRALLLLGAGLILGSLCSLAAGRWLEPLLYQVTPADPGVYLTVTLVLLATGVIAALLPSLRAGRVDPARALRAD